MELGLKNNYEWLMLKTIENEIFNDIFYIFLFNDIAYCHFNDILYIVIFNDVTCFLL